MISAPVHVQDFPARYSPQMGPEGANVLFDTWVHPLVMGLEEHLLGMFQEDFEFGNGATPSHLASEAATAVADGAGTAAPEPGAQDVVGDALLTWTTTAERELDKIPFFVRRKARRNTERYAREQGLIEVTLDTLYEAKAHFGGR